MDHAITVGQGKKEPQGRIVLLVGADPVTALQVALDGQAAKPERWWSTHVWREAYRGTDRWLSACAIGVDVDYQDDSGNHTETPADIAAQLAGLAAAGKVPGNLFHLTPRGARIVYVLDVPTGD